MVLDNEDQREAGVKAEEDPHATDSTVGHEAEGHTPSEDGHEADGGDHGHDPLAADHLMGHVKDAEYFEVPRLLVADGKLKIPQPFESYTPGVQIKIGFKPIDDLIEPLDLRITKFMVLEVVGAIILIAIFVPLARRMKTGAAPRGRLWNMFEAMVVFIRDQVARPTIGSHDADKFAPFLMTVFFFVLICNLLGLVPWAGSPTGALATTGALALITFLTVIFAGSTKLGLVGFWKAQVPHMELPFVIGMVLKPMIFLIEVLGLLIKHFVLAMRLLANMLAGHVVLAVIVAFILTSAGSIAWYGVMPASIFGALALNLLELFVAFLQAYIFAFLSGLFIGMAVHPH
jgi:F-type H+-transporting ATPase subunit a